MTNQGLVAGQFGFGYRVLALLHQLYALIADFVCAEYVRRGTT